MSKNKIKCIFICVIIFSESFIYAQTSTAIKYWNIAVPVFEKAAANHKAHINDKYNCDNLTALNKTIKEYRNANKNFLLALNHEKYASTPNKRFITQCKNQISIVDRQIGWAEEMHSILESDCEDLDEGLLIPMSPQYSNVSEWNQTIVLLQKHIIPFQLEHIKTTKDRDSQTVINSSVVKFEHQITDDGILVQTEYHRNDNDRFERYHALRVNLKNLKSGTLSNNVISLKFVEGIREEIMINGIIHNTEYFDTEIKIDLKSYCEEYYVDKGMFSMVTNKKSDNNDELILENVKLHYTANDQEVKAILGDLRYLSMLAVVKRNK